MTLRPIPECAGWRVGRFRKAIQKTAGEEGKRERRGTASRQAGAASARETSEAWGRRAMASAAPVTPMLGERRTRSARSAAPDKENCPPPKDNSVPGVFATPIGKGIAAAEGKTPGANFATPAGKTGEAPKTLEQWNAILRSLPIAMPSDRARLERLFERVLGSGSGNEELDVASNKDTDVYVALWLYRIALDPEEGTTYTKFMRKWGIGRKYAVVYVQQVPFAHAAARAASRCLAYCTPPHAQPQFRGRPGSAGRPCSLTTARAMRARL